MNINLQRSSLMPSALATALVATLVLAAGSAPALAGEIRWRLYARGEEEPQGEPGKRFPCGGLGIFFFEPDGPVLPLPKRAVLEEGAVFEPVEPILFGAEEVQRYPRPLLPPTEGAPENTAWFPCRGGSCFLSSTASLSGRPWAAVIDWNNEHGWSVGWTIHQAAGSDAEMVLFPLEDPDLEPLATKGESDAHVLAQICRLLEAVEEEGVPPPVVVNMSFGRLPRAEDLDPTPACAGVAAPRLSCQVRIALDHLANYVRTRLGEQPPTFVAAAGNHRQLLFPASAPGVIAAGSLQLGQFHKSGFAQPSWETPLKVNGTSVLLPGYGLCLFPDGPWLDDSGHYAPAGTSYAAGNTSGWALTVADQGVELLSSGPAVWRPQRTCSGGPCKYTLARSDGARLPAGRALTAVFEQIQRGSPRCAPPRDALSESGMVALGSGLGIPDQLPSLDGVAAQLGRKLPAPATSPCVPCMANSQSPPGATAFWKSSPPATPDGSFGLLVDSSGETNFPLLATLEGFVLRIGDRYLEIKLNQGLATLLKEDLTSIFVGELNGAVALGEQPSLIYVLNDFETGMTYWTSTPLLLR